jgi:hypothetical protein
MSRIPRNVIPAIPRQQIAGPGQGRSQVTPAPAVTGDMALLRRGMAAIGNVASGVAGIARTVEYRRIREINEERRQEAEVRRLAREERLKTDREETARRRERTDRRIDEADERREKRDAAAASREEEDLDRASASRLILDQGSTLVEQVSNMADIGTDADIIAIRERMLAGLIPEGASEAFIDQLRKDAIPRIDAAIRSRISEAEKHAFQDLTHQKIGQFVTVETVDEANGLIDETVEQGEGHVSESKVRLQAHQILVRKVVDDFRNGDITLEQAKKKLEMWNKVGGDSGLPTTSKALDSISRYEDGFQKDRNDEYSEAVGKIEQEMLNDEMHFEDKPAVDALVKRVQGIGKDLGADDSLIASEMRQIRRSTNTYIKDFIARKQATALKLHLDNSVERYAALTGRVANINAKNVPLPTMVGPDGIPRHAVPGHTGEERRLNYGKMLYAKYMEKFHPPASMAGGPMDEGRLYRAFQLDRGQPEIDGWNEKFLRRQGVDPDNFPTSEGLSAAVKSIRVKAQMAYLSKQGMALDDGYIAVSAALSEVFDTPNVTSKQAMDEKIPVGSPNLPGAVQNMTPVEMLDVARLLYQNGMLGLYARNTQDANAQRLAIFIARQPGRSAGMAVQMLANRDSKLQNRSMEEIRTQVRNFPGLADGLVALLEKHGVDAHEDPDAYNGARDMVEQIVAVAGGTVTQAISALDMQLNDGFAVVNGSFVNTSGHEGRITQDVLATALPAIVAAWVKQNPRLAAEPDFDASKVSYSRDAQFDVYKLKLAGVALQLEGTPSLTAADIMEIAANVVEESNGVRQQLIREDNLAHNKWAKRYNADAKDSSYSIGVLSPERAVYVPAKIRDVPPAFEKHENVFKEGYVPSLDATRVFDVILKTPEVRKKAAEVKKEQEKIHDRRMKENLRHAEGFF